MLLLGTGKRQKGVDLVANIAERETIMGGAAKALLKMD